ncbi:hypothetical protein KO494_08860 [Lacinutrix sp. C3R15]|uniref:hypothetical protein n=1 Tax=Flavobacteriaceae TaxID=49546 RepID=UPI001C099FD5|nr:MULTISPECIES: hypothetical protein [Flavobacteriaceae]MBU2939646.1 hypothetical protein [Lacinutrix sp. C3R15]MDO6622961.1 hypothetical protein [Oceanihabitans sp. 1_MG-2023]
MKLKLISLFTVLFSFATYACSCSYGTVSSRLNGFDYVFKAKIVQVLEYHENTSRAKKVKVTVIENFNNHINTNVIWFSKSLNGCPVPNPKKNSEWLFYITDAQDGKLSISACNPSVSFKKERYNEELDKIRIVKGLMQTHKEILNFNNVLEINSAFFTSDYTRSKRYAFDNDYGLYVLNYQENTVILKAVKTVKSLEATLDEKVLSYYNNQFKIQNYGRLKSKLKSADFKLTIVVWKTKA